MLTMEYVLHVSYVWYGNKGTVNGKGTYLMYSISSLQVSR